MTQPQAVTCTFRAVPPLAWHLLLRRPHAVRLRMTLNHQALTVTAAAPGIVSRPVRIPPNDHRTRTLLPAVRAGVSVTVRITGARQAIAGQLTY